jgi:AcrR family transcriptional regulator
MPKKVDHEERRALIAGALMRVAADRGLEAVSLRHVAAEAGVSAGLVQHYFPTKDAMMAYAIGVVRDHSEQRIAAAIAKLAPDPAPRLLLRTFIVALLPLDEPSIADARVALAFLAYTAVHPDAGASLRSDTDQLVDYLAGQVPGENATADAAGLLALMEGLGVYLLGGQYSTERALSVLDNQLDRLFAPGFG